MSGGLTTAATTNDFANAEERLDGQSRVFDEESGAWIQYTTPTNALIAKLHLESQIPAPYINSFLEVLHNPQFELKKLAFKSCGDIDRSVAEYRRAQSVQRATMITSDIEFPTRACLPYDIFSLLIDVIVHERLPLWTDDPSSFFGSGKSSGGTAPDRIASRLKALALTHRTLTPLAQRALGQRIIVHNAEHLRALSRSPLLGPWTTELLLNLNFPCGGASSSFTGTEDILYCVVEILQSPLLSELRNLRVRSPVYIAREGKGYLTRLLEIIGSLQKLESLCWTTPDRAMRSACVDVEDILRSTCTLMNLRRLAVHNARCGWVDIRPDEDILRFRLEELSLTNILYPAGPLEDTCISRLLQDSDVNSTSGLSSTLGSLTYEDARGNSIASILASSSSVLSRLHSLHLKLPHPPGAGYLSRIFGYSYPFANNRPKPSTLVRKVDSPGNLRTLHITSDYSGSSGILTEDALSYVPHTVRTLRLTLLRLSPVDCGRCSAQKNELLRFLDRLEREDRVLDELEIIVEKPGPTSQFSWDDINDMTTAKGCKITVKRELIPL
ncbi:hypothetical protein ACEPAG_1378 [Sanghuangporus baumii]